MTETPTDNAITLKGKSGALYQGKIYSKKGRSTITGPAIVCLANSVLHKQNWQHQVKDVFHTEDAQEAFLHFKKRDDRSHLLLITEASGKAPDPVRDLIEAYIHK